MRITDVVGYTLREPIEHPYVWRRGLPGSGDTQEFTILVVRTDDGYEGFSSIPRGAIARDLIDRRIRPELLGKDPLLKEFLWERMWELDRIEEFPLYMLGAVDIALWDITAKVANMPLWQLIGGNSERIQAYASTVTYGSIEEYLDVADQCIELGYRAIKLHAFGDVKQDAALGHALRAHVGDDIELLYDGSAGFDLLDSIRLGRELEAAGFGWYEEPMREFNIRSYRRLCEELDIPVLAAETSDGAHYNVADFIVQEAADLVRVSTFYKGGVTGALRVAHLADSFGVRAEMHGSSLPNLHVACAIPNNTYFEVLVFGNPVVFGFPVDAQGYVTAPSLPGIGWSYDVDDLESRAVAVSR